MPKPSAPRTRPLPLGIVIIHEDRDIIVIDKPAGLLTMGTDTDKERTAYFALTDYVRKGQARSRNRVFIVHRLDRETSGVLLFAKNETAKFRLQAQWEETEKIYLAIVQGKLKEREGIVENYLGENSAHIVYSTPNPSEGKSARTAYRVVKETKEYSVLDVNLLTGRKHQIRVHLAGLGHPIVGDKKYGKPGDKQPRLALHARSIQFKHPHSGEQLSFSAPVPAFFKTLAGSMG